MMEHRLRPVAPLGKGLLVRRFVLLACVLSLMATGLGPASAGSATPVPFPAHPKGLNPPVVLPKELDPTPGYVPQISCQPGTLDGVAKLRSLVLKTYGVGGAGNTARRCNEGTSEHADGRAWDWMVNVDNAKEKAAAGDFLAWLTTNHGEKAKRLGIMYVIHNKLIWGVYRERDGWRPSSGHTNHIHISFSWNGARGNTSFWKGTVQPVDFGPCKQFAGTFASIRNAPRLTRCPAATAPVKRTPRPLRVYGNGNSADVAKAQTLLGVKRTSSFDAETWSAVKNYQAAHDLPYTGVLDQPTWSSLVPSEMTTNAVKGYGQSQAAAYGLANYSNTPIGRYRLGKPVLFLQTALGMKATDRNGYFGSVTRAAVNAFQESAGLDITGIVAKAEWQTLAGQ